MQNCLLGNLPFMGVELFMWETCSLAGLISGRGFCSDDGMLFKLPDNDSDCEENFENTP